MAKFDHFNLISPIYDWVFGRSSPSTLLDLVNLEPSHALLDIGGGTGRITAHFSDISPRSFTVDSAMQMLREAQKKGLLTINANSEKLPFCNGCFDRIIMVDAFHHVADQQRTLDEIWRTLAPGGRLVIEEPDIHHVAVKFIALGEKLLMMRSKFVKPEKIMAMGRYEDACDGYIHSEKGIAWIVIDKTFHQPDKELVK